MIRKYYFAAALSLLTLVGTAGCSDDDTPAITKPDTEDKVNSTDPDKIGYDDGEKLIFNVKIIIDREALVEKNGDMQWFKDNLKPQWEGINERFNALDKENKLVREYEFRPDLEDILVFDPSECDQWGTVEYFVNKGKLDPEKFHCAVTYNFVAQEGDGGGGMGGWKGIGNVVVVHPNNINEFVDHLTDPSKNGITSIVHELGHFRGNIDTYPIYLKAEDNPFNNGLTLTPPYGNMNNPYGPTDDPKSLWNDYEVKVMNATLAKKDEYLIHTTMRDYFADAIQINVKNKADGTPVNESFTVRFYEIKNGKFVDKTTPLPKPIESRIKESKVNPLEIDAYELFWTADKIKYPWSYYDLLMVEVETNSKAKGYALIANYHVHNKGLEDKMNPDFNGRSIFTLNVDVEPQAE